jgi:HAD superfamily hydrolase (TIGR01509 family)
MKTILVDAVDTLVIEGVGIYKPLNDLLDLYPNPKLVLTNANDEQIIQFGLADLPYPLFTLGHNPDKTDPDYFKQMLAHFKLQADEVIYFEHNPDAVRSAESVGITSHFYDADKKDLKALQKFLESQIR